MIKNLFLLLFLVSIFSKSIFADPSPPNSYNTGASGFTTLRIFQKNNDFNFLLEGVQSTKTDGRIYSEATLGTKYRVHRNLKVGLLVSEKWGLRHDDDWQVKNGRWFWVKPNKRAEFETLLELSPRFKASFLPGRNWIFEGRLTGKRNFHAGENTLIARPGLTYFHFGDEGPLFNLFFQYEVHIPLNYGHKTIRENWVYMGGIYHLSDHFSLGGCFALYKMIWEDTDAFRARGNLGYTSEEKGLQWGLHLNFNNLF
jgi:hypothetical protein